MIDSRSYHIDRQTDRHSVCPINRCCRRRCLIDLHALHVTRNQRLRTLKLISCDLLPPASPRRQGNRSFALCDVTSFLVFLILKLFRGGVGSQGAAPGPKPTVTSGQSNMAKATSNPPCHRRWGLQSDFLWVPKAFHPNENPGPFIHVCTAKSRFRERQTDRCSG